MRSLKSEILRLLKEDEEFRYAVAGLIGLEEVLKRLDRHEEQLVKLREDMNKLREDMNKGFRRYDEELARLREDMNRLREDMNKGFRRYDEELARLREDMNKGFRRYDEELARLREDMNKGFELLRRHIDALGARWGLLAEESFRAGMVGVVERYFGGRVERWTYYDEEGFVFGFPSLIEVDMVISDKEHILVEIKSSVSRADVYEFWKVGQLYERIRGVKPRLAIVSPFVREEAKKLAKELGIDVYTSL